MAIVEKECNARRKQFSLDTMEMIVNTLNFFVESKEERKEWINRYFDGINHKIPSYIEAMKKKALSNIYQSQFCRMINSNRHIIDEVKSVV